MHICTVATLCFPEKTFPRNYYYCVQDENSLCLCFKNMYRTLFVAIFTSTFIFSMYDHIGLPGCVFPYLSKYKYQQSFSPLSPSSVSPPFSSSLSNGLNGGYKENSFNLHEGHHHPIRKKLCLCISHPIFQKCKENFCVCLYNYC